jgi:alkylated DNA nucleotide flippase Atl1
MSGPGCARLFSVDPEEYVEAVLQVVESIPPGRVMSYGAIAECVGQGGPRQVGAVMSSYGGSVAWWRVVRADGVPPLCDTGEARAHYLAEGTPLRGRLDDGSTCASPRGIPASLPPPATAAHTPCDRVLWAPPEA